LISIKASLPPLQIGGQTASRKSESHLLDLYLNQRVEEYSEKVNRSPDEDVSIKNSVEKQAKFLRIVTKTIDEPSIHHDDATGPSESM
jgi:hypothetical protein